jgi:drug/metabolite transporter (DMT)-like permease
MAILLKFDNRVEYDSLLGRGYNMGLKNNNYMAIGEAILAAALFGMNAPLSKLLLLKIPPLMMPALLYLGAGIGMLIIDSVKRIFKVQRIEARLAKEEMHFVILMVVLDIAAPILLMDGLTMTTSANASLLNNFEIVATTNTDISIKYN